MKNNARDFYASFYLAAGSQCLEQFTKSCCIIAPIALIPT